MKGLRPGRDPIGGPLARAQGWQEPAHAFTSWSYSLVTIAGRLRANPPMGGGEVKPIEASVNPDRGVLRAVTGGNLALERTVA
jgi:hypothetical protein